MKTGRDYKFWFCTGSQDLYGDECLRKVAEHSAKIVEGLNASGRLPFEVVLKPTLIDPATIRRTLNAANEDEECAGVITWMHTFSPAKMWILGLKEYRKPLCHLHTQFNEEIPYDSIDMDFMNENQSAHGDREYGHIVSRMGIERKIIVGHWANAGVQDKLGSWMRTAVGIMESSHIRVCRIGDNMNNVAVTEGDKVEAEVNSAGKSIIIVSMTRWSMWTLWHRRMWMRLLRSITASIRFCLREGILGSSAPMWRRRPGLKSVWKNSLRTAITRQSLRISVCWAD